MILHRNEIPRCLIIYALVLVQKNLSSLNTVYELYTSIVRCAPKVDRSFEGPQHNIISLVLLIKKEITRRPVCYFHI